MLEGQRSRVDAVAQPGRLWPIRKYVAQMSAAEAVRSYKALTDVERAFRSMKTMDLKVRPIHHHLADRVRDITTTAREEQGLENHAPVITLG